MQIHQAQNIRFNSKSCHNATNVKTTQIFSDLNFEPPKGMNKYRISH